MLTVFPTDRPTSTPAEGVSLPLRRLRVNEYHAMQELGVLSGEGGIELLEGLLIEQRSQLRANDPVVDGHRQPLHRLTIDEYHRLRNTGTLDTYEPCEFIEGLLIETMIRRPPHDTALGLLQDRLDRYVPADSIVRNQSAITLTDSEPEPDLAVVRGTRRDFADQHPEPSQIQLVVEIADASLEMDRTLKLKVYARHSIAQYWIVNLVDEQIEVYKDPSGLISQPDYNSRQIYVDGQSVPLVLDGQHSELIPVADILP